jgi:O-antigen/teichoic acid export membrane protein
MRTEAPLQRRLLLSAFTNWLAFAATLLVSFFLSPYLIHKLQDGPYGVWVYAESILSYFTLFDLGIAACLVRFVARFHTTGSQQELNKLASSCLVLFLGLGLAVFVVGAVLTPLFVPPMLKSGLPAEELTGFLLLMLGNLAFTLPLSLFPAMLDGLERFAAKSLIRIIFLAIKTIGTIILMERQPGLMNLGLLHTACNLAENVVLALLTFAYLPKLRFSRKLVDRVTFRMVRGYSIDAFLIMLSGRVCVQSAAIVIGMYLDTPSITWFAISLRLVEYSKSLLRSATITLTPAISSMEAAGDLHGVRRMFRNATRWVLYLIFPVQIGLIMFGKPFIRIWMGSADYAERCYPSLVILSTTLSIVVAQSIAARILYGMDRLRWYARISILEAGMNLGLSLLLIHSYGIEGVALATAIPNAVSCLAIIVMSCWCLRIGIYPYLVGSWIKPLVAAALVGLIWHQAHWHIASWFDLGRAILSGLAPYAIMVLLLEGFWRKVFARFRVSTESSAATGLVPVERRLVG